MMKTLDQVEARTAITNTGSTMTISQPASYYLTSFSTLVEDSQMRTIGGEGIQAETILRRNAHECGGQGIFAEVASECHGETLNGT